MEVFVLSYVDYYYEDSKVKIKGVYSSLENAIKEVPKEYTKVNRYYDKHLLVFGYREEYYYFIDKIKLDENKTITLF